MSDVSAKGHCEISLRASDLITRVEYRTLRKMSIVEQVNEKFIDVDDYDNYIQY